MPLSPTLPRRRTRWEFLGRMAFPAAVEMQLAVRAALRNGTGEEHLLLLEHPPVYTLGRNASAADVLADPAWLAARGISVEECDRGGQVTYHGPGQLVGYPVLNLSPDRRDVRRYVRDLQEVLIRTLADYGVAGEVRDGQAFIGVWAEEAKIASIGVHLSRWLTTHGFALNVTTDLSDFAGIVPCGLQQVRLASIQSLTDAAPSLPEVAEVCARRFAEVFGRELVPGARLPESAAAQAVAARG